MDEQGCGKGGFQWNFSVSTCPQPMLKWTAMKKLTFHPACLLFPQLPKDELRQLADDIKARGLLNDIVLHEGQILDGRNRWLACKIAKVKPAFVQWNGYGSPVAWVISENLIRRHLTSSQRAVVALDILPLLERRKPRAARIRQKFAKLSPTNGEGEANRRTAHQVNHTYVASVQGD